MNNINVKNSSANKAKTKGSKTTRNYQEEYVEIFRNLKGNYSLLEPSKDGNDIIIFSLFDEEQGSNLSFNTTLLSE